MAEAKKVVKKEHAEHVSQSDKVFKRMKEAYEDLVKAYNKLQDLAASADAMGDIGLSTSNSIREKQVELLLKIKKMQVVCCSTGYYFVIKDSDSFYLEADYYPLSDEEIEQLAKPFVIKA